MEVRQARAADWEALRELRLRAVADAPGRMHLAGMWVDPQHRRCGVAQTLVAQAVGWAEERRAREVILWVADHNIPARQHSERVGFRPTGDRQPLPSNLALTESRYRRSLKNEDAPARR